MNRLFAMFRYNKKLLWLFVCGVIDLCLIFGIVIFDVVQLILIDKNSALISKAFLPLNIVLLVLVALNIVLIISVLFLRKHREKTNELEKD